LSVAAFCGGARSPAGVVPRARAAFGALFTLVSCLFAAPLATAADAAVEPLEIVTASGAHGFEVEVARSAREREIGLMYRRSLPAEQGMLFEFRKEQIVYMWMKNTYISLDMIFVSKTGQVVGVKQNATPQSEEIITSGRPAAAVIELNAGVAKAIGVMPGDSVRHAIFK
jgi:uncharacterized protein